MAGHSKWANIKYRKERQDKKRSNLFSKLTREIIVCARQDPNPDTNPSLAAAIERARAANMPKENIERAIKRAAGDLEGARYEEVTYEGYGGVAILVRSLTDNRNRTAAAVRHIFESHGGSLGTEGCVAWQFERRGVVQVEEIPEGMEVEELVLLAIEKGAEDFSQDDGTLTFYTAPTDVAKVRDGLQQAGVPVARTQLAMVPKSTVRVEGKEAERLLNAGRAGRTRGRAGSGGQLRGAGRGARPGGRRLRRGLMRYLAVAVLIVGGLVAGGLAAEEPSLTPLLHGTASLILPGLGQYFNGEYDKALTHFLVLVAIDVGTWYLGEILPWWYPRYYLLSGLHALWAIYSAIDAYETALELEGLSLNISPTRVELAFNF